jgi:hypothetical protein
MAYNNIFALVEYPNACLGNGHYVALVYYGVQGGALHHKVFKYSHKDPRQKSERTVLQEVSRGIPAKHRPLIVAVSIVKRCLHPKTHLKPRADRRPQYERVFTCVVKHRNTVKQPLKQARRQHLEDLLEGQRVQSIILPYTEQEIKKLPIKNMITTSYWPDAQATVGIRGIERLVSVQDILPQNS